MPTVSVTTTYLEIADRQGFRPQLSAPPATAVLQSEEPLPDFYRFLYATVGRDYHWTDRLGWSDEKLYQHLTRPSLSLYVLYVRGTPAGYAELEREADEPGTEVAYFGLFSPFHGRGLGKYLLSFAVQRAFDHGAARVWVHTCTLDGPAALHNYQARGFVPYRQTSHEQKIADRG